MTGDFMDGGNGYHGEDAEAATVEERELQAADDAANEGSPVEQGEVAEAAQDVADAEAEGAAEDDAPHEPITSVHHDDDVAADDAALDVSPEAHIAESLQSALRELRHSADQLAQMKTNDLKVEEAERIAEAAAELDEQIGSIARKDDD